MMEKPIVSNIQEPIKWIADQKLKTICAALIFIGFGTFVVALIYNQTRALHAFLLAFFYFTSISLGGIFFAATQYVSKAGWSVNIRRFAEALSSFLPVAFGLAIIFILALNLGDGSLYKWLDPAQVSADALLQHKSAYLNNSFFIIRLLVFFSAWWWLAKKIVSNSLMQDKDGDEKHTVKNVSLSIVFIAVFTLSYSLFSVDTLMSLEPHWFSTIFGVYMFGGLFQSTLAVMILLIVYLMKKGLLKGFVDENHLHDLGKFLFAFTIFWAYIAFSQYMLIWYANLPEETIFFEPRSHTPWLWVSLSLILFKFIVPFFALLPRWAKRSPAHLSAVSILILIMQFVDLYWLIYPNLSETKLIFGFFEVGIFAGVLGAFVLMITQFFKKNALIPYKDPRIEESLGHHVIY